MSAAIGRLFGGNKKKDAAVTATVAEPLAVKKVASKKRRAHKSNHLVSGTLMKTTPAGSRLNRTQSRNMIRSFVSTVVEGMLREMAAMPHATLKLKHAQLALYRTQPTVYAEHIDGTIMDDPANKKAFEKISRKKKI